MDLFTIERENEAIGRLQRFERIANAMHLDICLAFSGGKDSQVIYDLAKRSGIKFKAYYNVAFESADTKNFIRKYYPEVIWRQEHPYGFIRNIRVHHHGFLPTVQAAYCCKDYKHNPKYVEKCSIVGVRRQESVKRRKRTAFEIKNKTLLKKNRKLINDYFEEHCQSTGTASIIQLKPIIDWTDDEVWDYIKMHDLPINPEYRWHKRVGCMVCPKTNFTANYVTLLKFPKLIDAFINAKEKSSGNTSWEITAESKDYTNDKPYYICRWLNHSFMPFTAKQEPLYLEVREAYDKLHRQNEL